MYGYCAAEIDLTNVVSELEIDAEKQEELAGSLGLQILNYNMPEPKKVMEEVQTMEQHRRGRVCGLMLLRLPLR